MTATEKPKEISVSIFEHRGQSQLGLHFDHDTAIKEHLKQLEGVKWTQTHSCFYIANTPENIRKLINHCRGVVWVDMKALRNTAQPFKESLSAGQTLTKPVQTKTLLSLNDAGEQLVIRMSEKIQLKGYSPSTLKNYRHHIRSYLSALPAGTDPLQMTKDDIEQYLLARQKQHPTSESDIHMHINAINPVGLKLAL